MSVVAGAVVSVVVVVLVVVPGATVGAGAGSVVVVLLVVELELVDGGTTTFVSSFLSQAPKKPTTATATASLKIRLNIFASNYVSRSQERFPLTFHRTPHAVVAPGFLGPAS